MNTENETRFKELVDKIKCVNGMMAAQLEYVHVLDVEDGVVRVEIPLKLRFLFEKMNTPDFKNRLSGYIEKYWGKPYEIELSVAGEPPSVPAKAQEAQEETPALKRPSPKAPEISSLFRELSDFYFKGRIENFNDTLKYLFSKIESPIENKFLAALICAAAQRWIDIGGPTDSYDGDMTPEIGAVYIWTQKEFEFSPPKKYRADFLIKTRHEKYGSQSVVVECDGHDFHEKTKEQAQRDKKRDRQFIRHGYRVIRFTGSEIHSNALECANEVLDLVVYPAN